MKSLALLGAEKKREERIIIRKAAKAIGRPCLASRPNNMYMNHLFYADDSCLLAASPTALQRLLDICVCYAIEFDITYNELKSHCMLFRPRKLKSLCIPSIFVRGKELIFSTSVKYLGIFINDDLSDNTDMERHIRYIYSKGNYLTRNFTKCSIDVKKRLFSTFCRNIYGGHLWNIYSNGDFKKVQVSYNNVYRSLFNVKRGESISQHMMYNNVDHFKVLVRKQMCSFRTRLTKSTNVCLVSLVNSVFFLFNSNTSCSWRKFIY